MHSKCMKQGETMANTYEEYNKYLKIVNEKIGSNIILSHESIITNTVVTSKRLINELETLESMLLEKPRINDNNLLIISAHLELTIQNIKKIKQDYLQK